MHYGSSSSRQRPNNAARSSRTPSGASVVPRPRPLRSRSIGCAAGTLDRSAQYGLNPKTVLKWRKRDRTTDAAMGPKARSTTLTEAEEAIIVEFRRRTLLPLDDVMGCLRDAIPKLTRSSLHRCLVRHGISRLPKDEDASSKRQPFKETKIGYVHIDSAQLRSAEGKTHMFLAIDRVSKFVHVEFHATAEMTTGAALMRGLVTAFPHQSHTVPTDNGVAFTKNASTKWDRMRHVFDRVCDEHGACATSTASSTGAPCPTTLGRMARPSA